MQKSPQKLMIVDGNALLHRAWHAIPPLQTKKGEVVNAVYGFITIFLKSLKELRPTHVAVTFDTPSPTFRHVAFKEYKAHREKKPEELYRQINRIREILHALHIATFEKDGYEADDVIATLAKNARQQNNDLEIVILTGDMDTLQLVDEKTHVCSLKKGISDMMMYDMSAVKERFGGLGPEQLKEVKALRGDPSDNIPGVKGIGEKTAVDLIARFGTLENVYHAIETAKDIEGISARISEKLRSEKDNAFLSYRLVQLVSDVDLDFSLSECERHSPDREKILSLFQELEFKSLIPRIAELGDTDKKQDVSYFYTTLTEEKEIIALLALIRQKGFCVIDTETTSLVPFDAELLGVSICCEGGKANYIPWDSPGIQWKKEFIEMLESDSIKKIGHNAKYDFEIFYAHDIFVNGLFFDTILAAYILNPGTRSYGLDGLSFSEFGYQKIPITALIGTGKNQISMKDVPLAKLSVYSCEDADMTFRLYEKYEKELRTLAQAELFTTIEVPVVEVLVAMEMTGVTIDEKKLATLSSEVHSLCEKERSVIYGLAGEQLNLNSTHQLKKILFEKLAIVPPKLKRGKTGISIAASELEKMRGLHPIIDHILAYRELTKLLNTYIDVLPDLVHPKTGRIHTNYNQTIAATGRLSSSNPNLQNIPIKTDLGRRIRSSVVAPDGYELVSFDYSQIELRIIASLAQDEKMIAAFHAGVDIHTATAAEVNGVTLQEVNSHMRRAAKEINFGILYGMGPHGLAASAGISFGEASQFIDQYFFAYPHIKEYIEKTIALARANGYSETIFGRRRYLPDLQSGMPQMRNAAERAAINMPVQGTAADIIKLAMIAVYKKIKNQKDVRMILQVHDELVFEVTKGCTDTYVSLIKKEMESVASLTVPLVVDITHGPNWEEMTKIGSSLE
ncbi:DNA polymerase I [Candidatus Uhrbacteria bacterium]|nr:DNA polymerase I [Candidatus Uhrbacteria bacterium]